MTKDYINFYINEFKLLYITVNQCTLPIYEKLKLKFEYYFVQGYVFET